MIKKILIISFFFVFAALAFAQQEADSIASLKKEFEGFKYHEVIDNAQLILERKDNLTKEQLIEVYMLKGISHFSLQDDAGAKECFLQILKIDSTFSFDPVKTSPKIISFFNDLKDEFTKEKIRENLAEKIKTDTVFITQKVPVKVPDEELKQTMIRSIIFPGLGQFYKNEKFKGLLLTSLGAIALTSSIYFIIDSNNKEETYQNAIDKNSIMEKYNSYNTAYKMKNISLISFAAVWLYSQIDALFFPGNAQYPVTQMNLNNSYYQLNLSFPF